MSRLFALILLLFAPAGAAHACNICHTETSQSVRHQVLEHGLGGNAASVAAPLPVLLAAILLFAGSPTRKPRR